MRNGSGDDDKDNFWTRRTSDPKFKVSNTGSSSLRGMNYHGPYCYSATMSSDTKSIRLYDCLDCHSSLSMLGKETSCDIHTTL